MNLERLTSSIKESEGYRKMPYRDTLGFWTVGFGHLIHKDILQHTGTLTFSELMAYYSDTPRHETWLSTDITSAVFGAKKWIGESVWAGLSDARREVLAEMRFQLGGKQNQFVTMKAMIESGDYEGAASGMLDSLWARQTPQRVHRLAQHMKAG